MKGSSLNLVNGLITEHPKLESIIESIHQAMALFLDTFQQSGKLLVCGNGGSCSDGEHIVGELMKRFTLPRPIPQSMREQMAEMFGDEGNLLSSSLQGALPAISLGSQTSLLSAWANDVNADFYFAQQVLGYGKPEDLLLGITTSGNSTNVNYALMTAKAMGMKTIALTGRDGGRAATLADCAVIAPDDRTFRIQEYHIAIYHLICAVVENEIFGDLS